jgi:hypothetical protein
LLAVVVVVLTVQTLVVVVVLVVSEQMLSVRPLAVELLLRQHLLAKLVQFIQLLLVLVVVVAHKGLTRFLMPSHPLVEVVVEAGPT